MTFESNDTTWIIKLYMNDLNVCEYADETQDHEPDEKWKEVGKIMGYDT